MKNLKSFLALPLLGSALLFSSCENESEKIDNNETTTENLEVTSSILSKIEALSFNTSDVEVVDFLLPDGTTQPRFMVEGDIALSPEYLETMELNGGVQSEQYRTNNLVASGTITVLGFTGGQFALSQANRNGLQLAVDNYNALNLRINMDLDFGTNFEAYDMVIYKNPNESGSGGSAGFPSNGAPNKFIQIFGLDNSSNNVNEHVIGHEIGHSIGFRHTDWFSRQSCGQNTNEGTAGVGAVLIPGTPQGFDATSLMLSCFSNNEDGEFGQFDVVALNFLY